MNIPSVLLVPTMNNIILIFSLTRKVIKDMLNKDVRQIHLP